MRTLAVWYDYDMRNNEGNRWLHEMRTWWRKVGRTLNRRTGGDANIRPHFTSNHGCHGGLTESRRTVKQNMVKRFVTLFSCVNCKFQICLKTLLSHIFSKRLRTETNFNNLLFGVFVVI